MQHRLDLHPSDELGFAGGLCRMQPRLFTDLVLSLARNARRYINQNWTFTACISALLLKASCLRIIKCRAR